MAKEYISREAALSFPFANGQYDREHADEHFIHGCESYREWIEQLPAADVVEVVRCRECKHYDCEDGDQKCVKDAEWVEDDACYYGFISYHGPEFFCADGERKDGGQDDV